MAQAIVSFAESALRDLESIRDWHSEQGVPEVGQRILLEIFERLETLAEHPGLGRRVPEFNQPELRELIHLPFRLVYWRGKGRVRIIRVWRSERQLQLPPDST